MRPSRRASTSRCRRAPRHAAQDLDRALYDDRRSSSSSPCAVPSSPSPGTCCPPCGGARRTGWPASCETRLAKEVESNGIAKNGAAWVTRTCKAVLKTLGEDGPATTAELRERIPTLARSLELSPGKSYGGSFPIAPRLLSTLAAGGQMMRGGNDGDWRLSRPRWTLTEQWLGEPARPEDLATGYRLLVERWLRQFGPGTEADLAWWLGATKGAVRRALGELDAVEVLLDDGATGYLLPDDLDEEPEAPPWGALLPVLDPTTMGWKERAFYLGAEDVAHLFDSNGNAGTTAWWNGRIVGCWVQDPDGVVWSCSCATSAPRPAGRSTRGRAPDRLARRTRVSTVYTSAAMKAGG